MQERKGGMPRSALADTAGEVDGGAMMDIKDLRKQSRDGGGTRNCLNPKLRSEDCNYCPQAAAKATHS